MGDTGAGGFRWIEALPTTFLIDRNGQIRDRKVVPEPTEDYEKKVVALVELIICRLDWVGARARGRSGFRVEAGSIPPACRLHPT